VTDLQKRVAYMRRDFDLSTFQRSRYWAEECRGIVEAMLAAPQAEPVAKVVAADLGPWQSAASEFALVQIEWLNKSPPPVGTKFYATPQPQASAEDVALVGEWMDCNGNPKRKAAWQRIRASLGVGK
jgi:hypothetical protein